MLWCIVLCVLFPLLYYGVLSRESYKPSILPTTVCGLCYFTESCPDGIKLIQRIVFPL